MSIFRPIAALLLGAPFFLADGALAQSDTDVRYGRRLLAETNAILEPEVSDPSMRHAGNNLSCSSCHLEAGTRPGMLSLKETYGKYPREMARSGRVVTIQDRVNGCMTRSMNGEALPEDGREMQTMVAFIEALAHDTAVNTAKVTTIPELDRPADPARGARFYDAQCAGCHGTDGLGVRAGQPGDDEGYLHPPLWGPDSFNDGAGMARLINAANFIHAWMPYTTEMIASRNWRRPKSHPDRQSKLATPR